MDRMEKKPVKMSVPQFGAWEHKPKGVPTDYSMVFNIARENKKNHKTDITEVKRLSLGNEMVANNATNNNHRHRHGRGHGPGHHGPGHHAHADSPDTGRWNVLSYMNCCTRPRP